MTGKRYTAAINATSDWKPLFPLKYRINLTEPTTTYTIYQKSLGDRNPADLTIDWGDDWGDGKESFLWKDYIFMGAAVGSHTYSESGTYIITLYSAEADTSKTQMPKIYFNHNNNSDLHLIDVLTPFPNMGTNDFSSWFTYCINLRSVSNDLFKYNPQVLNLSYCFAGCSKLSLSSNLFPDSNAFKDKNMNFNNCFTNVGIGLAPGGTAPSLWTFPRSQGISWSHTGCFLVPRL